MPEVNHIYRIGGSTISGILGISPWESPHSIYLKMIGEYPRSEATEAMKRGNELEPMVAGIFAGNHPEFDVEEYGMCNHAEYDFLTGSPDRVLIDKESGELSAGLEIKTANIITRSEWGECDSEHVPPHYWAQCQWYAGLMGVEQWYLAVSFFMSGSRKLKGYEEYIIQLNREVFNDMIAAAVDFWNNHVLPKVPPQITAPDSATSTYYKRRYPYSNAGSWLERSEETDLLAEELLAARQQRDEADEHFETLKLKLVSMLGENEGVQTPYGKITYKSSKSTMKTNWEAAAKDAGASERIIQIHTAEIPGSRRFLISQSKKEK